MSRLLRIVMVFKYLESGCCRQQVYRQSRVARADLSFSRVEANLRRSKGQPGNGEGGWRLGGGGRRDRTTGGGGGGGGGGGSANRQQVSLNNFGRGGKRVGVAPIY